MGSPTDEGSTFGLQWTIDRQHGLVTVQVTGELDLSSVDGLEAVLVDLISEEHVLVADLGGLEFMDSTGIRLLARIHQQAKGRDTRFLIAKASAPVRRVLDIAGLSSFFEYVEGAPPSEQLCRTCETWVPISIVLCTHCGAPLR